MLRNKQINCVQNRIVLKAIMIMMAFYYCFLDVEYAILINAEAFMMGGGILK